MTILSAQTIRSMGLVTPCADRTELTDRRGNRTTYGLGPAGYDLRLDSVMGVLPSYASEGGLELLPGEFRLASAMEYFMVPNDVMGIVHDKSSWARRGLAVQNTVIEPGWRGYLTLELTNHSRHPIRLERGQGICQVVFHRLDEPTELPYRGKYQDQASGPQVAR